MTSRKYVVEVLTPCFCAGIDQKRAEIRAPSIRGQLRWWFRALGGTFEQERQVFGGVHGEAVASRLVVRVMDLPPSEKPVAMRDLGLTADGNYLIWPLRQDDSARGVIAAGARFTLTLSWRLEQTLTPEDRERVDTALHAWLLLGALGTRCRRGWGSVFPAGGDLKAPTSVSDLRDVLAGLLGTNAQKVRVISIGEIQQEYRACLNLLGGWMKRWRAYQDVPEPLEWGRNDHDAPLGQAKTVFRPVLGLPLAQRYSKTGTVFENSVNGSDHWGSPVHLKVVRLDGGLLPVAIFFPMMAMPEGTQVTIKNKKDPRSRTLPASRELFDAMMTPPEGGQILL
jgi:CRISPR type III-B/RAMP module RAMP protein Cmr1